MWKRAHSWQGFLQGWAAWPHALPQVCPPLPLLPMEETTSRCENIIVFSVLLIAGVIASHKIFVCLFLFSPRLGFWFALKSIIHLECWGVASRAELETAGLYFHGLTHVQTSDCCAVIPVLLLAPVSRSALCCGFLCECTGCVLSVPCLGIQ